MEMSASQAFEVRPIAPHIGAEIFGLDVSQPLSAQTIDAIRRVFLEHVVIFFREQRLSPEQLLRFARCFGELDQYPFVQGMDGYPEIVEVIKKEDELNNFGGVWHSDTTYLERPPMGSMLYAVELPPVGGDTLFSNMYLAYESLSAGMRQVLDGLHVINSSAKPEAAVGRNDRKTDRPRETEKSELSAIHPLVRTHPETGRKVLFVNPGHSTYIDGFSVEESRPILEYLFRHQQRAEFSCRFHWQPGSLAFWDNRAAQHYALNDYHGYRRVMQRVTFIGERPV
jgi:taurine dioxygenase